MGRGGPRVQGAETDGSCGALPLRGVLPKVLRPGRKAARWTPPIPHPGYLFSSRQGDHKRTWFIDPTIAHRRAGKGEMDVRRSEPEHLWSHSLSDLELRSEQPT